MDLIFASSPQVDIESTLPVKVSILGKAQQPEKTGASATEHIKITNTTANNIKDVFFSLFIFSIFLF
jgi:hypothetical protein